VSWTSAQSARDHHLLAYNQAKYSPIKKIKLSHFFAYDCRVVVDMDRKAAALAASAPCSNRSTLPAVSRCTAANPPHAAADAQNRTDRQTDGRTDGHRILPHTMRALSIITDHDSGEGNAIGRVAWV